MTSPVQEGYYQQSLARERYYNQLAKSLINSNVGSDGTINNNNLNLDEYKSPGINKDASTVNDLEYYNLDEYKYEISDSDKKVEARKEPITDTHFRNTSVGTTSVDPAIIGVGIIGRGGGGITQGMISGGTSIVKDVLMDFLTDSSKRVFIDPLES